MERGGGRHIWEGEGEMGKYIQKIAYIHWWSKTTSVPTIFENDCMHLYTRPINSESIFVFGKPGLIETPSHCSFAHTWPTLLCKLLWRNAYINYLHTKNDVIACNDSSTFIAYTYLIGTPSKKGARLVPIYYYQPVNCIMLTLFSFQT
jgi:hypothetical protein